MRTSLPYRCFGVVSIFLASPEGNPANVGAKTFFAAVLNTLASQITIAPDLLRGENDPDRPGMMPRFNPQSGEWGV
jgi:hypothetical protein